MIDEHDKSIINRMIHDQLESLGLVPLLRQSDKLDLLFKGIRFAIQKAKEKYSNEKKIFSLKDWMFAIQTEVAETQKALNQYLDHGGEIDEIRSEAIDVIVTLARMIIEKLDPLIERDQKTKEEADRIAKQGIWPS